MEIIGQLVNRLGAAIRLPGFSERQTDTIGDLRCKNQIIASGILYCASMAANGSVGGGKAENRFAMLQGHLVEAPVVADGCHAAGIILVCCRQTIRNLIEHRSSVDLGNLLNPLVTHLDWPLKPNAGLLAELANWLHPPLWKPETGISFVFGRIIPLIQPSTPRTSPSPERRAKNFQSFQ